MYSGLEVLKAFSCPATCYEAPRKVEIDQLKRTFTSKPDERDGSIDGRQLPSSTLLRRYASTITSPVASMTFTTSA
jgi:hypothetical protein